MDSENNETLLVALKKAIELQEFVLYYQPQFNTESCKFEGVEALIRWRHPIKGIVLPSSFIQQAEESNLIVELGEWILKSACAQNKSWQDKGLLPIRVAVNVSEKQFLEPDFVGMVRKVLNDTQLDPSYLELELSENIIINDETHKIINAIQELKKDGIKIALDDFGTGYSSINYLKKIPVDRIKIDRDYIQYIDSNPEDAKIVRSIVKLAHNLNLQVIAEGVETLKQLKAITNEECREAQGFYFCEPKSAEDVEKFLLFYQTNPFKK